MAGTGEEGQITDCECVKGVTCASCSVPSADDLSSRLEVALGEIDRLTKKLNSIEKYLKDQNHRLRKLESSGDESSEIEQIGTASITHQQSGSARGTAVKMCKMVQVEDENDTEDRELPVRPNIEELYISKVALGEKENVSEDFDWLNVPNRREVRRKLSNKQRNSCNSKVASRSKLARGIEYESDSSSTTCTYSRRCSTRRKVKSGANIKKRPVIRTELWPHTIANEDDGEDVTSEDIGLAKFLACFTYILTTCDRAESVGRALLLHAVTTVLECLPWAEARAFHNMVLVKLEQGRFEWDENFSVLAEQYIDKKVRMNLRSRGGSYGYKAYPNSRSSGKSFSSARNGRNPNSDSSKSFFPGVCRLWNFSTCTYGERCNRSHVCLTCADAGKPGEQHKASSHENSRGNESPGSRG